jgi:hypothetical protein
MPLTQQAPEPKSVTGKPLVKHTSYYAALCSRATLQAEQTEFLYSDPFLTCAQAMQALNVSYSTIRKWRKLGLIHGQRTGPRGRYRFRGSEIQRVARLEVVE